MRFGDVFSKYQPFTQNEELFRFVPVIIITFQCLMCLILEFGTPSDNLFHSLALVII